MNKLFISILVIAIIGAAFYLFRSSRKSEISVKKMVSISPSSATSTGKYTIAQVQKHNKATDCWMAIEGKVYDVTQYIADNKHPGGKYILEGCGKDATQQYNDRPENEGPHSATARALLKEFYIGDLQ